VRYIAPEKKSATVALHDGEGEHALEVVDEAVAPVVVGLEENLGVAVREEAVAAADQILPQLLIVVDAPVPGDGQAQLRVHHRLSARFGQIDDFQTTVTESHPALRPHARRVGTPGCHRLGHGRYRRDIRCPAVETDLPCGSAHSRDTTHVDGGENTIAM
jgi:hypothetical protein